MTAVPIGPPQYRLDYPADEASAGQARRDVSRALATWSLSNLAGDAAQVITELMANAAQHTGSSHVFAGVVRVSQRSIRIEVFDGSPVPPRLVDACDFSESGRGILMVDALANEWGWQPEGSGKKVWAVLSA